MTYATERQICYLRSLIAGRFANLGEAMVEYGLPMPTPANLTKYDASSMIEWLADSAKSDDQLAAERAAADARAAEAVERKAEYDRKAAADAAAREAMTARVDALMEERGLSHLTGQARRDARYAINLELRG